MTHHNMSNTPAPPSKNKLLHSAGWATIIAITLLVTTILPAEYGIDPTGVGQMLGLSKMGEIKTALHQDKIKQNNTSLPTNLSTEPVNKPIPSENLGKNDEMTITLKPNEAAEVKVAMRKGEVVRYHWQATGPINVDAHGDSVNVAYHAYGKATQIMEKEGSIEAVFDGSHGWYWRNRSKNTVVLKLKTSGKYNRIKKVL